MAKYRKKPVVIEAVQWTGKNALDIRKFVGRDADFFNGQVYIKTLEGTHHASVGDFIIKGVKGEFYPCKPDIFAQTYEPEDAIDPETLRPKGRWESNFYKITCSSCKHSVFLGTKDPVCHKAEKENFKFCPECGAKMEGT